MAANPEMNEFLEELNKSLNAFRMELRYTDWQDHPRLLDVIRSKDKLVALSQGDYKALWEIEKKVHQETQERAATENAEMKRSLFRIARAYLKRMANEQVVPSSCAKCRLPSTSCKCTDTETETSQPLWHLANTMPTIKAAEPASTTPALPSSPPPERNPDDDLYS